MRVIIDARPAARRCGPHSLPLLFSSSRRESLLLPFCPLFFGEIPINSSNNFARWERDGLAEETPAALGWTVMSSPTTAPDSAAATARKLKHDPPPAVAAAPPSSSKAYKGFVAGVFSGIGKLSGA